MALSCYLFCWSVQTALLVLLTAATGARLVAANLDGRHYWLRTYRSFTTFRQEVGMVSSSSAIISLGDESDKFFLVHSVCSGGVMHLYRSNLLF